MSTEKNTSEKKNLKTRLAGFKQKHPKLVKAGKIALGAIGAVSTGFTAFCVGSAITDRKNITMNVDPDGTKHFDF